MNDNHDQTGHDHVEPSMQAAGSGADWRTTWTPSRRHFLTLTGLAVGGAALGLGVSACGTAQTGSSAGQAKGRAGAAGETMFVAGFQWSPPKTFNPLAPVPDFPTGSPQNHPQYIYESLLRFNLLDGSLTPGLAKELQQPDDQTFTLPLQDGTKWSDGSDLTADDVVFTFELGKSAPVYYATIWQYIDSVKATDPRTVEFKLKSKPYNPIFVKNFIAATLIVPKAVFGSISADKIPAETNLKPIGSGPFLLDKADPTQVNLKRNDNYWGKTAFGTPPMTTINHPIFKSNNDGDLKLESGEIDASQQFTAQIWKMWEAGKPVSTWMKKKPYHVPGQIPLLIFNLNKKGLDNPKVRLAIAYSIDYANIATTAMSDYSEPANASLIIPTGWTDWNTACEIVAKSVKEVGIDISTEFPQAATMQNRMQVGDFDLCMYNYTGVNPASPWIRFRDALDDRGVPDYGKPAFWNYNRFKNSEVAGHVDAAAAAKSDAEAKTAYTALDKIYRENVPVVPLMYRPLSFYEFNANNWENFPTEENPYAPPMWSGAGIQWLFKIKKVAT